MLDAIQRYLHKRRRGLIQSATFMYGSYTISAYVSDRMAEMKDKMLRDKLARDNLRRRFQSTHDDVCFTIMALLPTLASRVLEDLDVEALTNELQSISRASRSRTLQPSHNQPRSQSVSEMSSVSDVHSDPGSASFSSHSGSGLDGDRSSVTSGSWIEHMSASEGLIAPSGVTAQLSDSITSASSSLSHDVGNSVTSTSSRTKGQLWNEVKILALTRTLTTLYTITLLSLLTAVQLNLLGRSRYIDSVRASERAERARDQIPDFSLAGILAREAMARIVDTEEILPPWVLGENGQDDDDDDSLDAIAEETELRFLTLSWWVLHVGWKDVAARVRSSVESVFDDVSLKTKLSPSELFAFIMDVRRRVEIDGTGGNLSARFLSTLLPPTPETTSHVLAQGGALSTPRETRLHDTTNHFVAKSPLPSCSSNHSSIQDSIEQQIPPAGKLYDGQSHTTAIPIESPKPRPAAFSVPPSSHAHGSDLSSQASQSPSSSSVHRLCPPLSADTTKLLSTSRSALDVDPQFNALLAQTRRYLSGPDFAYALGCALDRATEILMDGLRARIFVDSSSAVNMLNAEDTQAQSRTGDANADVSSETKDEIKVRLAGMLPGLARWSQLALNATPNELVDNIMSVREVNALEAIIISDYEDRFPAIS